jgi:hypothetical protein
MAGIEEAFEKFSDRLARQESKRYSRDEQGEYNEYLPEVQDPYPIKLGPLQLGGNANIFTRQYSPDEYQNISTMNSNVGLRGKYNVPDSGIALLGSIGDVRSSQNVKTNLPFNPMTGEASPYSEMRKDVYKDSPYSVGAQYTPQGTNEMYSALYNKGGGYNLGYNKGPVNVSYTSNPGLGSNVMLRGQYNFADGGRAGYRNAGSVEPFYINEMTDKISDPTIGGIAGMLPSEVVGGATGLLAAKAAKGLVDTTVKLTKKEKSYLKELMSDTGGGKFTAEILEEAPSLKISGDKLIVKQKDLQNLDKFLKDLRISEQAPSGVGANTIPPRLRDFSTDNNVVRQLYRNTPGYTGYSDGGRVSMSEGGLTTTVPPDKGPDSQGVESLFRRRYS